MSRRIMCCGQILGLLPAPEKSRAGVLPPALRAWSVEAAPLPGQEVRDGGVISSWSS